MGGDEAFCLKFRNQSSSFMTKLYNFRPIDGCTEQGQSSPPLGLNPNHAHLYDLKVNIASGETFIYSNGHWNNDFVMDMLDRHVKLTARRPFK